ncbi:MAG: hypothetical protein ABJD11_09620 [Gemmatimonadota bacterium]
MRPAFSRRSGARRTAAFAALGILVGCSASLKESGNDIGSYISRVTDATGTIVATLHPEDAPSPNGGPVSTVAGIKAMVNGGSSQQTIAGSPDFTSVIVAIPGVHGYYELTLPASSPQTGVVLGAQNDLPNMNLTMTYAVTAGGAVGTYVTQPMQVIHVGTGDVQVSVSWSDSSDVDLHVVDPNGEEIYYGHRTSVSKGSLDLDSNAGCSRDASGGFKSNENIVWPASQGVAGTYIVRLDHWSACGATAPVDYVVTVNTRTGGAQVFSGTFNGAGDSGGAGSGILITNFAY